MHSYHDTTLFCLFNNRSDSVLLELRVQALCFDDPIDESSSFFFGSQEEFPYPRLILIGFYLDLICFLSDASICNDCFALFLFWFCLLVVVFRPGRVWGTVIWTNVGKSNEI